MRGFDFVQTESTQKAVGDEYCLDVQCPWRIEGASGIITGRLDLWKPAEESEAIDWDTWDYQENENLQDRRLCSLLGDYEAERRRCPPVNRTDRLVVEEVQADDFGGAVIELSGGYRLVLFPASSRGENWRVFRPRSGERHFVVEGSKPKLPQ